MTNERWTEIWEAFQFNNDLRTQEEKEAGWHFCCEWDELLVGPGMDEVDCCDCWPLDHPIYNT